MYCNDPNTLFSFDNTLEKARSIHDLRKVLPLRKAKGKQNDKWKDDPNDIVQIMEKRLEEEAIEE